MTGEDESVEKRVLELRNQEDAASQSEVADKVTEELPEGESISQTTVSRIERAHDTGKQKGKDEGYEEAIEKVRNFEEDDDTDTSEDDDYWCHYCEDEGNGKVEVDYLQDSCPNGHDLTDDWANFQ